MKSKEEIFKILQDVIIAALKDNNITLSLDTKVADLDLDSLLFISIVSGLEAIMAIDFPPEYQSQAQFENLSDVVDKLHEWQR